MTARGFAIYLALLLALVTGLSIWGLTGLTREASIALQKWGDAAPAKGSVDALAARAADALPAKGTLDTLAASTAGTLAAATQSIQRTSDNLNRKCKGEAGPDACGTLAQFNKTVIRAGDAIVTTQKGEVEAVPHMTRAMDAFADAAYSLDDAGRSAEQSLDSFNDLLASPDLSSAIEHVDGMTSSGDAILGDARKVADKATADWLKPVPWWKQPIAKGGELIDIGAAIARHVP